MCLDSSLVLIPKKKKNTPEGRAGVVGPYGVKRLHLFTF